MPYIAQRVPKSSGRYPFDDLDHQPKDHPENTQKFQISRTIELRGNYGKYTVVGETIAVELYDYGYDIALFGRLADELKNAYDVLKEELQNE